MSRSSARRTTRRVARHFADSLARFTAIAARITGLVALAAAITATVAVAVVIDVAAPARATAGATLATPSGVVARVTAPVRSRLEMVGGAGARGQAGAPTGSRADTCVASWAEPYYYLWEFAQLKCEATHCDLGALATFDVLAVVWFNYGAAPAEKPVRVTVWEDAGGMPGAVLWSSETTTGLLEAGETRLVEYAIDPPLVTQDVWFGHQELVDGPPSSLFDESAEAEQMSAEGACELWTLQWLGDYLQVLAQSGGTAGIEMAAEESAAGATRLAIDRVVALPGAGFHLELDSAGAPGTTLRIFDVTGRMARDLTVPALGTPGRHVVRWDAASMPAGVYFLALRAADAQQVRKLVIIE